MSRRITILLSVLVMILVVGAGLAVYVLLPAPDADPAATAGGKPPAPAATVKAPEGVTPEPAAAEAATAEDGPADTIPRDPFLGLPEDYDLSPAEFHRRRLASQTLGRPDPGTGPVRLPGFRYVTLDRPVIPELNRNLKDRMDIYKALLAQKIPTAAPLMILLHNVDLARCAGGNPDTLWEIGVPVLPEVTSVQPPLVLKEIPESTVVVQPDRSMRFDPVKECSSIQQTLGDRFGGKVLIRNRQQIPVGVKYDESMRFDFILVLK
jgi:hypothetical protein